MDRKLERLLSANVGDLNNDLNFISKKNKNSFS